MQAAARDRSAVVGIGRWPCEDGSSITAVLNGETGDDMRILHTADWHIGKTLHGHDLLDDQKFALGQIIEIAKERKVEAIVIAGDLYDRGNPAEEAVQILDEALHRLCEIAPVLAIAGNHDSGTRLDFGRRLMASGRLHLVGTCHGGAHPVTLEDAHGQVVFHLMPFAMPEHVREALGDETIKGHDAATARRIAAISRDAAARHVLVGHLFVQGGTVGDTERSIAVGGVEHVDPAHFGPFAYTALGHLHRPHSIGASDRIRYSGSLCRCSFSEEDHAKSVSIVELDGDGAVSIDKVEINQRLGMRTIEGLFDEVMEAGRNDPRRELDWIRVVLTDPTPIYDAMRRLTAVYPHVADQQFKRAGAPIGEIEHGTLSLDGDTPRAFLDRFLGERLPESDDDALRQAVATLAADCLEEAMREEDR